VAESRPAPMSLVLDASMAINRLFEGEQSAASHRVLQ
jgi:hypothetical protein